MENGYSLIDLLLIFKRRWLIISLMVVLGLGTGAAFINYIMTPKYQVSSQFIVNQSQPAASATEHEFTAEHIRSNVQLINTYNVIIKSPAILNQVKDILGLEMSIEELKEKIGVSNAEESQVVDVSVIDENPETAAAIANTTVLIFKESIPELMNVDNVQVLSQANTTDTPEPVSPDSFLIMLMSLAGGLAIGGGIAFLLETYDTTIKGESDVMESLDVPFMGSITNVEDKYFKRNNRSLPSSETVEMRGESIGS